MAAYNWTMRTAAERHLGRVSVVENAFHHGKYTFKSHVNRSQKGEDSCCEHWVEQWVLLVLQCLVKQ